MRILVVGGSGLIGDKVMTALHDAGHKPVAASPAFEIDAFTGEDSMAASADRTFSRLPTRVEAALVRHADPANNPASYK